MVADVRGYATGNSADSRKKIGPAAKDQVFEGKFVFSGSRYVPFLVLCHLVSGRFKRQEDKWLRREAPLMALELRRWSCCGPLRQPRATVAMAKETEPKIYYLPT